MKENVLLISSLCIALGAILNMVACIINQDWIILVSVVFYLFSAIPIMVFDGTSDPFGSSNDGIGSESLKYFLTAGFLFSAFFFPFFLLRQEAISSSSVALSTFGAIFVFAGVGIYAKKSE